MKPGTKVLGFTIKDMTQFESIITEFRTAFRTPFRTDSERRETDFVFSLKKLQKEPEILRFQAFLWSEWRDLNSRPLDPQTLRLGFVCEKLRKYGIFVRFQNIGAPNIPYFLYFTNQFHRYSTARIGGLFGFIGAFALKPESWFYAGILHSYNSLESGFSLALSRILRYRVGTLPLFRRVTCAGIVPNAGGKLPLWDLNKNLPVPVSLAVFAGKIAFSL